MTGLLCRSGLFGIALVLMGSWAAIAAPMGEREGLSLNSPTQPGAPKCHQREVSYAPDKIRSWNMDCPSSYSPMAQSDNRQQANRQNFVWGDSLAQTQSRMGDFIQCLTGNNAGTSGLRTLCQAMGIPGAFSGSMFSTIPDFMHSLYEFDLPENKMEREFARSMALAFPGSLLIKGRKTVVTDGSGSFFLPNLTHIMQLIFSLLPDRDSRNMGLLESTFHIELEDNMTTYTPKFPLLTPNIELGDLLPLFLLLFLLPNYKRLLTSRLFQYGRGGKGGFYNWNVT